jgi:hypothetical protein
MDFKTYKLTAAGTTFLTFVSIVIAIYIYFDTSRAEIDSQIQLEGADIISILQTAPTYEMAHYCSGFDEALKTYQKEYPSMSRTLILEQIGLDLSRDPIKQESVSRLSAFIADETNKTEPNKIPIVDIFLWLVVKSIDDLAPKSAFWHGRCGKFMLGDQRYLENIDEFPYGLSGVKEWSDNFKIKKNLIDTLHKKFDTYKSTDYDFDNFKYCNDKPALPRKDVIILIKNTYSKDYQEWLDNMQATLTEIDRTNNRLRALMNLRKRYDIFPTIVFISIVSFAFFILLASCIKDYYKQYYKEQYESRNKNVE